MNTLLWSFYWFQNAVIMFGSHISLLIQLDSENKNTKYFKTRTLFNLKQQNALKILFNICKTIKNSFNNTEQAWFLPVRKNNKPYHFLICLNKEN